MRGEQHAYVLVSGQLEKDIQHFFARSRVEPAGWFIEDEQPCVVRESERERELDAHALGQIHDALLLIEVEKLAVASIRIVAPIRIELACDIRDKRKPFGAIEVCAVELEPNLLLDGVFVSPVRPSEVFDGSAIGVHRTFKAFQGGRFPRAVSSDEARYGACLDREGNIVQLEGGIGFREILDAQERFWLG